MKRVILACLLFLSVFAQSATIKDLFLRMPITILPTVSVAARRDLVDFYLNQRTAVMPAAFNNLVTLKVMTASYMQLQTSSVSTLQLKALMLSDSTQIIALIQSVNAPLPDSRVQFFTREWKPLATKWLPAIKPHAFLDVSQFNAQQITDFDALCQGYSLRLEADETAPLLHAFATLKNEIPNEPLSPYLSAVKDSVALVWKGDGFQLVE